jgi:hypothetical protein
VIGSNAGRGVEARDAGATRADLLCESPLYVIRDT